MGERSNGSKNNTRRDEMKERERDGGKRKQNIVGNEKVGRRFCRRTLATVLRAAAVSRNSATEHPDCL